MDTITITPFGPDAYLVKADDFITNENCVSGVWMVDNDHVKGVLNVVRQLLEGKKPIGEMK